MSDPQEEEINKMGRDMYEYLGFFALFILGILHLLKIVTFDWIVLVVFTVALLPGIARIVEYIKISKDGLEAKMKEGVVTVPRPPEPLALHAIAAADPIAPPSEFGKLSESERNILKTLWHFQKGYGEQSVKRWGFSVGPQSLEFMEFGVGSTILQSKALIGIGKQGLVYLTDQGLAFCAKHRNEIDAYPLVYKRFVPA